MINCFSISSKEVKNISLKKISLKTKSVVFVESPSKEEINLLSSYFELNKEDLVEATSKYNRPKVDEDNNTIFFLFATACDAKITKPVSIGVFLQKNVLLIVSKTKMQRIEEIKKLFINNKFEKELKTEGLSFLTFKFLDKFVESFFPAVEKIDDQIELIEKEVLNAPSKKTVEKIFGLKKKLIFLHKAFSANREVIMSIEKEYFSIINKKTVLRFKDTYYDINQLIDIEETYRDIVTSALDIYLSMVSNNLNVMMKKITVIGSILLIPTLISGIFGMNFLYIPFANHPLGFYGTVFGMSLIFIGMFYYSKIKNWI